jgi:hypothetical protein
MRRRGSARAALLFAATWLLVTAIRADEAPGASSLDALIPAPAPTEIAPPAAVEPPAVVPAPAPAPPPSLSAVEPQAMAALKRMLDALVYAQALHVRVESEYDAVRESGETLSFSRATEITLRRPDRLRIESSEGAEAQRVLGYDGRYLTLYDARENLFAAIERESDLDGVLAFVRDDVGIDLPLAPLF